MSLKKEIFDSSLQILALRIPANLLSNFRQRLSKFTLTLPKTNCIVDDVKPKEAVAASSSGEKKIPTKLLLLNKELKSVTELPSDVQEYIKSQSVEEVQYDLKIDYSHYSVEQVLRRILPADAEIPSSYEAVGHIAHLNLRYQLMEYKNVIGQVILDKNPSLRTVVTKLGSIDSQFREFKMEVIAGDEDFETEVNEGGCVFQLNYSQVYWNSRLQMEHARIVSMLKKDDIVCDMFCGIGPFALPAAKQKGCVVHANDLNPKSYHYLCLNAKRNKVTKLVQCYNMDASDFLDKLVRDGVKLTHVLMNLPASSVSFLPRFVGIWPHGFSPLPTVHCYTFSNAEDTSADAVRQVEEALGGVKLTKFTVHAVRDVSPKKMMMCVSFELPAEAAWGPVSAKRKAEEIAEGQSEEAKKQKSEESTAAAPSDS